MSGKPAVIESMSLRRRKLARVDPYWRTSSYSAPDVVGVYVGLRVGEVVGVGASAAHPRRATESRLIAELDALVPILSGCPISQVRQRISGRFRELHPRARLAVDLALHDLIGKLAGLPAESLWGESVRSRIEVARMIGLKEPTELVSAVRPLYDAGVRAFKIKIGDRVGRDLERIVRLRTAFHDATLTVDANGAYARESARSLVCGLGDLGVSHVEQPLPYDDVEGMVGLRQQSPVPLMVDQLVRTVGDVVDVAQVGAADLVSVKLTKMGSIGEATQVAHVCAALGLGVHLGGSAAPGICDSALTRLALTLPGVDPVAEVGESRSLDDDEVAGVTYDGRWAASDGQPGLGGHPTTTF